MFKPSKCFENVSRKTFRCGILYGGKKFTLLYYELPFIVAYLQPFSVDFYTIIHLSCVIRPTFILIEAHFIV
jgi:hypothetical protein